MKRFDVHSTHGGASDDDGDVPVVESHGHGEAHMTVMLLAAKKKRDERRFPAKTGDQSWLAGCARN